MLQYKYINSSWETVSQQRASFHKIVHVEYTSYTQLSYFPIIFLDAHPILKLLVWLLPELYSSQSNYNY